MGTTTEPTSLYIESQVQEIRRGRVESDKFAAEQRKLIAAAKKLHHYRRMAPVVLITSLVSSVSAAALTGIVVYALARILH